MKKILAMLLAVMLLALPTMSLAASPAEMLNAAVEAGRPLKVKVEFEPGAIPFLDAEIEAIVNDVIDALGFTAAQQGGDAPQFDFAMQLSGVDVLTLSGAQKGEEIYVKSNLLGSDVLAMNGEEAKVVLEYLLNMAKESGIFSASELEEIKASLENAVANAGASMAVPDADAFNTEALLAVTAKLMEKVQIEENPAQPKNCDPAAQAITMSLTGEDIAQVYDVIFDMLKENEAFMNGFKQGFDSADTGMTADEMFAKMPEAIREATDMIQGEVPVTIYLDEAGMPVYGTASMTMKAEDDTIAMDMNYARLTVNQGVTHAANLTAKDANNAGVGMSFNMLQGEKLSTANLGVDIIENGAAAPIMNVAVNLEKEYGDHASESDMDIAFVIIDSESGEEISFNLDIEQSAEKVGESDVKYEAEVDVHVLGLEKELFSIEIEQITGEATESIVVDDVVRPGAMTEDEFATWMESVANSAQTALIVLVQNLPSSVLKLVLAQ